MPKTSAEQGRSILIISTLVSENFYQNKWIEKVRHHIPTIKEYSR